MSYPANYLNRRKARSQKAPYYEPHYITMIKLNLSNFYDKGILITFEKKGSNTENTILLNLDHSGNFGILQLNYKGPEFHDYFPPDSTVTVKEILLKKSTTIDRNVHNGSWDIIHIITKKESDCNYLFKKAVKDNYTIILAISLEIVNANNSSRKLTLCPHNQKGTPLHRAVTGKDMKTIEALLECNVAIDVKNKFNLTPLHVAVEAKNCRAVELILKKNLNINMTDKNCITALHLAVKSGYLPIIELFLKNEADVNLKGRFGKTALHIASESPNITINIIKFILNSTNDINTKDNFERSAIHYAALNHNVNTLKYLLQENTDVNAKDFEGKTALHLAINSRDNYFECVEVLINHKADINAIDRDLTRPLHLACFVKNVEVVKYLIGNGADSSVRDKDGRTIFHYANMIKLNRKDLSYGNIKYLEPLFTVLIKENISVNCVDKFGKTPLHYAAENNNPVMSELFLHFGADLNILDKDHNSSFDKFIERMSSTTCSHWSTEPIAILYKQHVMKMKFLKRWVRESILDKINEVKESNVNLYHFSESAYSREIDLMQSTNLDQSNISYYDFLKKSSHDTMNFSRNQNIVNAIESNRLIKMFPTYSYFLKCHLREAQRRSFFYEKIEESLKTYIFVKLPSPCMSEILRYLNDSDLTKFLKAIKPIVLIK